MYHLTIVYYIFLKSYICLFSPTIRNQNQSYLLDSLKDTTNQILIESEFGAVEHLSDRWQLVLQRTYVRCRYIPLIVKHNLLLAWCHCLHLVFLLLLLTLNFEFECGQHDSNDE